MLSIVASVFTLFASSQAALENAFDASHYDRLAIMNEIGTYIEPSNEYCNISVYQDNTYVRSILYSNVSCASTSVSPVIKLIIFIELFLYRFASKVPALTIQGLR